MNTQITFNDKHLANAKKLVKAWGFDGAKYYAEKTVRTMEINGQGLDSTWLSVLSAIESLAVTK